MLKSNFGGIWGFSGNYFASPSPTKFVPDGDQRRWKNLVPPSIKISEKNTVTGCCSVIKNDDGKRLVPTLAKGLPQVTCNCMALVFQTVAPPENFLRGAAMCQNAVGGGVAKI